MNEQMTKMSTSSSTALSSNIGTILLTEDGISQADDANSLAVKIPVNNGQLDSRLTKALPIKTNSVPKISKVLLQQQPQQQQIDASIPHPIQMMSRLNMLNVGKAVPFSQAIVKTHGDYLVKVCAFLYNCYPFISMVRIVLVLRHLKHYMPYGEYDVEVIFSQQI